jgi:hypothetical protein
VAKYAVCLLIGLLIAGCGSPKATGEVQRLDPKDQQPNAAQSAERKAISAEEVANVLDLEEYPGAVVVENVRLVSPNFAPDEVRLELVRRSKDDSQKVVKFYEGKLGSPAGGEPSHQEVFGRTPRGSYVRVHVDSENSGSKFTIGVISYLK